MEMKKRIIVVIGMHRSGTSAVSRGLIALGVDLGSNLMPALENNNEKGFWEDFDVYTLNIEILSALGRDWHTLPPVKKEEFSQECMTPLIDRAVKLISEKMAGHAIFGMKDPRISRLLPFWKQVFEQLDLSVSYVICLRHPLSVAASLRKRDGLEPENCFYLWLEHMVSSILESIGYPSMVVSYDRLMDHPKAQLLRIAERLDLPVHASHVEAMNDYKTYFLEERLRHTRYSAEDLCLNPVVPKDILTAYDFLEQLARDEISLDAQDTCKAFRRLGSSLFDLELNF
jgi:hypothetical protein